jgi:hypothetical protein
MVLVTAGLLGCYPRTEFVVSSTSSERGIATLSKRDSGAMSYGSTLVSIREKGVPDNDTHGLIVFGARGDQDVKIAWKNARNLMISCSSCKQEDVNYEVVKSDGVIISYSPEIAVRN